MKKLQPIPLQFIIQRDFSTTDHLEIKGRWKSKWKNSFPHGVYTEMDLDERCFDKVIDYKPISKWRRKRLFMKHLDELINFERVVLNVPKGRSLARLAELLIDTAKKGDENGVYCLLNRKELLPKVFDELLPRYLEMENGYTNLYRIHSDSLPAKDKRGWKGNYIVRAQGCSVIEFKGNGLPPLVPSEEELEMKTLEQFREKKNVMERILKRGTML